MPPSPSQPPSGNGNSNTPVRSLLRGLEVLACVNELAPASVAGVVAGTGLPKATVIRLLKTLREAGYVGQHEGTGHYEPLPAVRRLASAWQPDDGFITEAGHLLNALATRVSWPAELMMADLNSMTIRASNRSVSPISLRLFEQTRFPVLQSAGGIAWLSALAPGERQELVMRLSEPDTPPGTARDQAARAFTAVEQTQARGYSMHTYPAPVPGLRAIGVPLPSTRRPPGALVLLTLENVVSLPQLEAEPLAALKQCTRDLATLYDQMKP